MPDLLILILFIGLHPQKPILNDFQGVLEVDWGTCDDNNDL